MWRLSVCEQLLINTFVIVLCAGLRARLCTVELPATCLFQVGEALRNPGCVCALDGLLHSVLHVEPRVQKHLKTQSETCLKWPPLLLVSH